MNHMLTNGVITVVTNGRQYQASSDHPNYAALLQALKDDDEARFIELVDLSAQITKMGNIEIKDGELFYKGEKIDNSLTRRIIELIKDKSPADNFTKFLDNVMLNPSRRAINELYNFLAHECLPITDDGCFLAYKAVRSNYLDKHSGKFDNSPGQSHRMERNAVCDDADIGCSYGFHVGSLYYATTAFFSTGDRVVIVKVNPADVVSVPKDYEHQKLRTCAYEVISDYVGPLNKSYYSANEELASIEREDEDYEEILDGSFLSSDNVGDSIEFMYRDGETRFGEIQSLDGTLVRMLMDNRDKSAGEFRSFYTDEMHNIVFISKSVEIYNDGTSVPRDKIGSTFTYQDEFFGEYTAELIDMGDNYLVFEDESGDILTHNKNEVFELQVV